MDGEFNNLNINNTPITFNSSPNNIATSDELDAPLMYQDKMDGTLYAKRKRTNKIVVAAGITLLVTAASIASGSIISNAFILNPPKISESTYNVEEKVFKYDFTIVNDGEYNIVYTITIGNRTMFKEDCSTPGNYVGTFNEGLDLMEDGYVGIFKVTFSNQFDYTKQLVKIKFNTGGIIQ